MKTLLGTWALLLGVVPAIGGPPDPVPLYDNLGTHHHAILTRVPKAQQYFDQGLRLMYAFNPEEALLSFQEAARLDPRCLMCFWGIGLAYGPNINIPMDSAAVAPAYRAAQRALVLAAKGSPIEAAYARALASRYTAVRPADRAPLDSAYARAMGALSLRFPADLDAATLYAEAMLDLRPWDQWFSDGQPQPGTLEVVATLESVLRRHPAHPGACHYYIHAVEASRTPERALPCAEQLPDLMPGAGHLVHMPAHIYLRLGRYADAVQANEHAAHADEHFIADRHPTGNYPQMYYPHNLHFLSVASMMEGNSAEAITAARKVTELSPAEAARAMAYVEYVVPFAAVTLARFGRWKDVLAQPAPAPDLKFATGIWLYCQGMARAAIGDPKGARVALDSLRAIDLGTSAAGGPHGALLLRIAVAELRAELAARQRFWDQATASLQDAVAAEDSLSYNEPSWAYYPARQTLGGVLLAGGHADRAEVVYREDLARNPRNGWSLYGLAESLQQQGKPVDSAANAFAEAWANADMHLPVSPY